MTRVTNMRDLAQELENKRDLERIIFVCAEGRMQCIVDGRLEPFGDLKNLIVRRPSKSRIRRGFWGAYGDVPLIIGRLENGNFEVTEHAQHPFEYFEIVGRPVKRLCGHSSWLPPDLAIAPPVTIQTQH